MSRQSFIENIGWEDAGLISPPVSMKIAHQPVVSCYQAEEILYNEALARFTNAENQPIGSGELVSTLENMGRCHLLDGAVLKLIQNQLSNDANLVVGWNVSAESIREGVWPTLVEQIERKRLLASRLVIEVTEYRSLADIDYAIDALRDVQRLGCRVALDDFGTRFATPELLLSIDFDIIKIDKVFLHRTRSGRGELNTFQHLVGYASYFAPYIVAEGIENDQDLERASKAGVTHCQGYLFAA